MNYSDLRAYPTKGEHITADSESCDLSVKVDTSNNAPNFGGANKRNSA